MNKMPVWLLLAAVGLYAVYRTAHMSSAGGHTPNYTLNAADGGLAQGTKVYYAGSSTDLLAAMGGGSVVNVIAPDGKTYGINAGSLNAV